MVRETFGSIADPFLHGRREFPKRDGYASSSVPWQSFRQVISIEVAPD